MIIVQNLTRTHRGVIFTPMPERPEAGMTPETTTTERQYTTLRGFVIKSTALLGLGGALAFGYGINQVRIEENETNQEKRRVTREFYKTHPDPNPGQLFELQYEVDQINKISKTSMGLTIAGGVLASLSISVSSAAYMLMPEESHPSRKKKGAIPPPFRV